MITKNDCLSLLVKLEDQGVNIDAQMRKLVVSKEVPLDVLKFISGYRGIEVGNFYEMLRKRHNQKKSPLYTNILKEVRAEEVSRVLNTYFKTGDASSCITLLKLIKSDLLVLEYISGRRELAAN